MVREALSNSVSRRRFRLIELLSENIMTPVLSQLFFLSLSCFWLINANSITSASKVICMCKPVHRRWHERPDGNSTMTCLAEQTLPGTGSFYLRVNMN